jgi:hypothetical protein
MSPTWFDVAKARRYREGDRARLAGDLPALQAAMGGLTQLSRAYYGSPLAA